MKRHTSILLFLLVVAVGFVLVPSIGPSWDEPDNMFSAGVYVNFFTHGCNPAYFRMAPDEALASQASAYGDRIVPQYRSMAELPPVHNYVGIVFALAAHALHYPVTAPVLIIAWHLATVLFFALLVAMTYRFGLLLGLSARSSLLAALTVFLYPQLFGHGFSNSKDTAQTALVVTSLYYLVRATAQVKVKKKDLCIGAVVWGLGMATKFNAVYVPIVWGIWYLFQKKQTVSFFIVHFAWICVIGFAAAFAVWPYLWFDTIAHVLEVVRHFTTVGEGYRVIWNGTWYMVGAGKSLWWYPLMSFFYTTPVPLLALIFFGSINLLRQLTRKPVWAILPIWIVLPLVRTLSPWSAFYDLTRHFMEILPATLLVAAVGFEELGRVGRRVIAAVVLGQLIFINVLYFPYSTGYYNMFARNPNVNFDRDIEALSVKESMDYVHRRYGNVRIYFAIGGHLSRYYLTAGDWYVNADQGKGDIVVAVNKASHFRISDLVAQSLSGYTMVHQISRGDAIFAWIYKKN